MTCEFKEDIGEKAKFLLKTGRQYSGEIKGVSENNFVRILDIKGKKVKFPQDNVGSAEYE